MISSGLWIEKAALKPGKKDHGMEGRPRNEFSGGRHSTLESLQRWCACFTLPYIIEALYEDSIVGWWRRMNLVMLELY